jgi:tetratricopeptide (TPR) repeat protein
MFNFKTTQMKKIKSFLAVCLLTVLTFGTVAAQDMQSATDLFNAGGKALGESNYIAAIESFNKSLKMLETLTAEDRGEEGDVMIKECKDIIPQIHLRYGKELATSGEIDNSIVQIKLAAETATKYNHPEVAEEATSLIPQLLLANASNLLNAGKLPESIAGFKKVLAVDPQNADAYVRMGVAESRLENEAGALAAFEKAMELGETDIAPKQIAVIYLKRSAAAVRTKNWAQVFDNAKKSNGYNESAQANKLVGLSAVQLKKFDDAIAALESYYAADPNAQDKSGTLYNLAVAYEGKGNNAKACGYYKQLLNDATYKQIAEYKVKTQLKCN